MRSSADTRARRLAAATGLVLAIVAGCGEQPPRPEAPAFDRPVNATPAAAASPSEPAAPARMHKGRVSHYGDAFAGRKTASGEPFDPQALTMAHRTLSFGTRVRVTNTENGRSVEVVVNDRGPFVAGRIADLSHAAARRIGMVADGVVDALIEIRAPAK